ncbi:MAG: tyrosine-type recombinase/integrase [Methanomethylovorans sp.]|uniref:tyrosine-type recombinase/integrase n=1 Tax=Methanomethylovorans sp. TaxID=2758717 RepID=UPI003530AEE6
MIEAFLQDCKIRGRTKRSLESYKSVVKEFLHHYPEPERVDKHDLRDYLEHLQERDLHIATLKTYFSAISSFYDFLIYEEVAQVNPILPFRQRYLDQPTKHDSRQIPSLQDVRALIERMSQIEHIAPIVTLAKTGARFGEYFRLEPDHLDFKRDTITLPEAAKRHNRMLPMDLELKAVLELYLEWREPRKKTKYLWVSEHGGHIHKDWTNEMIAYYAEPLGLHKPRGSLETRLTCHCFRGFFTTSLREAGMTDEYLQQLRGDSINKETWKAHYLSKGYMSFEKIRAEYLQSMPELL